MNNEIFYIGKYQTIRLEYMIQNVETFEEFESKFSDEFLNEDRRVGNYLEELVWKYGKDNATVSVCADAAFLILEVEISLLWGCGKNRIC